MFDSPSHFLLEQLRSGTAVGWPPALDRPDLPARGTREVDVICRGLERVQLAEHVLSRNCLAGIHVTLTRVNGFLQRTQVLARRQTLHRVVKAAQAGDSRPADIV